MIRFRRLVIIGFILQALACGDARGQVSAELLPDPVDSRDLTRLLKHHVMPSVELAYKRICTPQPFTQSPYQICHEPFLVVGGKTLG